MQCDQDKNSSWDPAADCQVLSMKIQELSMLLPLRATYQMFNRRDLLLHLGQEQVYNMPGDENTVYVAFKTGTTLV